jgi:hypothetical protein
VRKAVIIACISVFVLSGCSSPNSTSTPNATEIPEYSFETSPPDDTENSDNAEETSTADELQSKYLYFSKNDKVVVEALLEKRCMTNGWMWIDFTVKDTGDYIFVVSDAIANENGQSRHPVISYIKAESSNEPFKLLAGGSTEESWIRYWGCPVQGTFDKYNTQVSMTTQQLINEGY